MLVFTNSMNIKKLNKILILAGLLVSANLDAARLRSTELRRGTAAEKSNPGFLSKVSQKYKAFKKVQSEKKEKIQVINSIYENCLNHLLCGQDISPQMNLLENLIKQNPWALESKNLSWTIEQMAPMGDRAPKKLSLFGTHFVKSIDKITPLEKAITNFQWFPNGTEVKEIETLINLGSNVNVADKAGNTPILNILDPLPRANFFWMPIAFKMLLDKNADLNVKNKFGETAKEKINKLPQEYAKIIFGLINEKQIKLEATKVLNASLPTVISNLICEYITTKDECKLELDAMTKAHLGKYASFYE